MQLLAPRLLATASSAPDRIALVHAGQHVSYDALARMAQDFAAFLLSRGVVGGERVAMVLPNGLEAIVACYGAWLAGVVAVPLNVQGRRHDLGSWLGNAQPRVVVHETNNDDLGLAIASLKLAPMQVAVGAHPVAAGCIAWQEAMSAGRQSPVASVPSIRAESDAVIVYTSGTTGAPKGVVLTHANLAANTEAIVQYLSLGETDSTVSLLPFYYSYGASVLHSHLAVGGRLVLEPNLVFPHQMVETMVRERVTGFSGVASTYSLLLDRVILQDYDLTSLRYLTQAGGPMSEGLAARIRRTFPDADLFQMYGQTEATARIAWLPPVRASEKRGSVGVAVAGTRIEVHGLHDEVLPAGMEGEVCVQGPGIMRGYWNDPEATAGVLRGGWLHTGDVGHLDRDGFLYLTGRRSDMIKTGAHRVHPNDVEEVIAELPGVLEAAVAGMDDATLGQVVKAWVVVRKQDPESPPLSSDAIRAHCRARIAPYKVPKVVEFVESLPRTASGKVRRHMLSGDGRPEETV